MNLEEYLDEEFGLLGVDVRVRHLLPDRYVKGHVSAVTFAYVNPIDEEQITDVLDMIEVEYEYGIPWTRNRSMRQAMIPEIRALGYRGFAVCGTPKSKKTRRIIAKGRLLKVLRKERFERPVFYEVLED